MKIPRYKQLRALLGAVAILLIAVITIAVWRLGRESSPAPEYSGAASCRECHERFYQLWAPSHHGLAMQPFSAEFAGTQLAAQRDEVVIGDYRYRVEIEGGTGWVRESGPEGTHRYAIEHVLGGKNVYFFLTPLGRGRLQVLPLGFDVREQQWYDITASMVRHFHDVEDEALDWRERPLTFNTSCYGCHVSQLSTNYDLESDSYHTVWLEPGINCETCHGPGAGHIRACEENPDCSGDELAIISQRNLTTEQTNASCAPCHAKMIPITTGFRPGDRFFDHYDLVTLEHPDFYSDGRDLGENYTYTLWLMSPCVAAGQLGCQHCHTSSGRYRHTGDRANEACMPCHEQRVRQAADHTHHAADGPGNVCVSCHMPKTEFARMQRSDHSMRPPVPAATVQLGSPNACNLCHSDRDAAWAERWVRAWHAHDYQAPVLEAAGLIQAARERDWTWLVEMLAYIGSPERDVVVATSLVRLLASCDREEKWSTLVQALKDRSPLVRAAAASGLAFNPTPSTRDALMRAVQDEYRLVRVRAAYALSTYPGELLAGRDLRWFNGALEEYLASLESRPDDWASHYNKGNYYLDHGEVELAIYSFEMATRLQPRAVEPLVNLSLAYNLLGENVKAEESLRRALSIEPSHVAANLNLGLLLAELGREDEAEGALRAVLAVDPGSAVAAYNLGILAADHDLEAAIGWCRKARELAPSEAKYAYTHAYYLHESGAREAARRVLEETIERHAAYGEAYLLLGAIYEGREELESASALYQRALGVEAISARDRYRLAARLEALQARSER
jgi:tetratricopeptide (TPR) repeat protein